MILRMISLTCLLTCIGTEAYNLLSPITSNMCFIHVTDVIDNLSYLDWHVQLLAVSFL